MGGRVRRVGKKTSSFTAAIEKWWNRKAEVKMIYDNPLNVASGTVSGTMATGVAMTSAIDPNIGGGTAGNGVYNLFPPVVIGTGPSQAIGQFIQPRKLIVDLRATLLNPKVIDPLFLDEIWPEDIIVHIFVMTAKQTKNYDNLTVGVPINQLSTQLMGYNGIQVSGFDGSVINSDKPVNTELYTVIKRMKFRLNRSAGFKSLVQLTGSSSSAPPSTIPLVSVGGQDSKRFKFAIPVPKRIQLVPTLATSLTGNIPSTFAPFLVAGWTYAHSPLNQTPSTLKALSIQATTQLYYTDD